MKTIDLKPRAIAVLCALRSGPRTQNQIGAAIGDGGRPVNRRQTADLLTDMGQISLRLITQHEGAYYLTHDGLGWLQSNGLDAVNEAKINELERARRAEVVRAERAADAIREVTRTTLDAVERCPYGNMSRAAGSGEWHDWHRGHGCHLDPERGAKP